MKLIVATDKNWAIGNENGLLVHLPGDLKYFKEKTLGKVIIMGRKTLESLPKGRPLPNRTTIVLTSNAGYSVDFENTEDTKLLYAHNFEELMTRLLALECMSGIDLEEDVFVAGGASIYELLIPFCNEFYVTRIDAEFPADTYFPNLDEYTKDEVLKLSEISAPITENGITYKFVKYVR